MVLAESITVAHAVPGRIRLRVSELRNDSGMAQALAERLTSVPGILGVETSTVTGSVVIRYLVEGLTSDALRSVSEVLMPLFPALDTTAFHARLTAFERELQRGNGDGSVIRLDRAIGSFLGTINAGVGKATGGVDLRLLLPLALFVFGVRGLLIADRLALPSWYDLLWFSFGTFVALNAAGSTP